MFHFLLAAATAAQPTPDEAIIVTGSRIPVAADEAAVSATVFEEELLESLTLPSASDLLRLAPGVSVSTSGPRGTLTQIRIRGAEATHTLLFVDGIRFNDPAAANEPRFELLAGDALSRLEVVRGPQSALWGSEALGGVVDVQTGSASEETIGGLLEYGSNESLRSSARAAGQVGGVGVSGSIGWLSSAGIDSFGVGGERDGFDHRSAGLKAVARPLPSLEIGAAGHWIAGLSDFDGYDPATFRRADTLDSSRNRIGAGRLWAIWEDDGWALELDSSYLGSANRNLLADEPLNRTFGKRWTGGAQLSKTLSGHRLTAAGEREEERFRATDQVHFGLTDQNRSRSLTAVVGQWRAQWTPSFLTDLALRHDSFSAFGDATTVRALVLVKPARGWALHAGYGEGIAQPGFFDLFGFFPGSFVGNPALRPESSRGWEAGVRWSGLRAAIGATVFSTRLRNEIVETFDPVTFIAGAANVEGKSRRRGVELDARYGFGSWDIAANYTYLDAGEGQAAGRALVRETRRPRHSANLIASGTIGPLTVGAGLAYVGERSDVDFDLFPTRTVTLGDYLLGSIKLGYRISPAIEAYGRIENAFAADYQDVVGFNTPGRTVYAGLRLRLGR